MRGEGQFLFMVSDTELWAKPGARCPFWQPWTPCESGPPHGHRGGDTAFGDTAQHLWDSPPAGPLGMGVQVVHCTEEAGLHFCNLKGERREQRHVRS